MKWAYFNKVGHMINFQMELRWETAAFARFIYGQTSLNLNRKSLVTIFRAGSRLGWGL